MVLAVYVDGVPLLWYTGYRIGIGAPLLPADILHHIMLRFSETAHAIIMVADILDQIRAST